MTTVEILRPLTDQQKRVWEAVRDYHAANRIGCGFRVISRLMGFSSPNAAFQHCLTLRAKGWLTWNDHANSIIPTLESLEACDD
jgi:SOS-response transcriptional repressor LexA